MSAYDVKLRKALAELLAELEAGREWPDVAKRIARKNGVTYKALSDIYDGTSGSDVPLLSAHFYLGRK
jgi:hypothetical protein